MWTLLLTLADTGSTTPRDSAAMRALAAARWHMDSTQAKSLPIRIAGNMAWVTMGTYVSDTRLFFRRKNGRWEMDSVEVRAIR